MQHPAPQSTYDASDPFGSMSGGRTYPHTGSDYRISFGTVESIANAQVLHTGFNPGNGNYVCVYLPGYDWLPDGTQGGIYVAYLHLSEIHVREGESVVEGQAIGVSGNSGTNSRGPHLHITISNSDRAYLGEGDKIDPYAFIERQRAKVPPAPKPQPVAPKPPAPRPVLHKALAESRAKIAIELRQARAAKVKAEMVLAEVTARLANIDAQIAALKKQIKK